MAAISVDYDALWQEQMKVFDRSNGTADYWDQRSKTFDTVWRTSNYAVELIRRMKLSAEYSVLDVACGTGVMALPLSIKVSRVTALDISPSMLARLRERIEAVGITNIATINRDWNSVVIGKDIEAHDVVLVSRSLPYTRLSETLARINQAAKSACYITWRANHTDDYEIAVREAMGKPQKQYPDYSIIAGMAERLGYFPNVEIFENSGEEKYPDLETAVSNMARGARPDARQSANLLKLVKERMKLIDGYYTYAYTMKWALISWQKK